MLIPLNAKPVYLGSKVRYIVEQYLGLSHLHDGAAPQINRRSFNLFTRVWGSKVM